MEKLDKEQTLLYTDDLTGIYNRRFLDVLRKDFLSRLSKKRTPYTVAVIDVDHFKSINDTYGHLKGDAVIKEFASFLRRSLRGSDIVIRYGGDEFVCIQPELRKEDARFIWERMLKQLKDTVIAGLNITMSVGLASYPEDADEFMELFSGADAALYEAKRRGRGRVAVLGTKSVTLPISSFIDREKESDIIERIVHEKLARVRVVSVVGPVGIGKTRLIREVLGKIRGREIIWSDCLPFVENIPYYAIRELIKYRLKRLGKESFSSIDRPYLTELVKLVPEITNEDIKTLKDQNTDKYRLYESVRLFLDTGEKDKIVVVDNLQWADPGTLEVLKYLVLSLKDRNIVYIFVKREEEENDDVENFLRDISRVAEFTEISPKPFDKELVEVALRHILSSDFIDPNLIYYVYVETGGNPFYLEELVRELYEQGYIELLGDGWVFREPEEKIIPKSIEDITERKYKRLSDEGQKVVDLASVIGYFDMEILAELTGFNEGHILGLIDELISMGIAKESFERIEFREGISRKTIYSSHIGKARRKVYHRKIAEILIERYNRGEKTRLMEIASHLYHAGDSRAPYWLLLAAREARMQYSYKIAKDMLEWGLELIDRAEKPEKTIELDIYQELIDVCHSMGMNPNALEIADKAITEIAEEESPKLASFYQRKAMILYALARYDESINFAEKALSIYKKHNSREGMGNSLNVMGIGYLFKGEYELAEKYLKEAGELFKETGNTEGMASVYNNLGAVYDRLGRLKEALSSYLKSLDIAREYRDLKGQTLLLHNIGSVYLDLGEFENAKKYLTESLKLAEKIGDRLSMSNCHLLLGLLYKEIGEFKESLANYKKCSILAEETGDRNLLAWAYENTGEIHYLRGEFKKAKDYFKKAKDIADNIGNTYLRFYNLLDTSRVLLEMGLYRELHSLLDQIEEIATKTGSLRLVTDYLLLRAHAMLKEGNVEGAIGVIEQIKEKDAALYRIIRGEIMLALNNPDETLREIESLEDESLNEFYRAWALKVKGKALILKGEKKLSREVLNRALSIYNKMEATKRAEEISTLLQSTV